MRWLKKMLGREDRQRARMTLRFVFNMPKTDGTATADSHPSLTGTIETIGSQTSEVQAK